MRVFCTCLLFLSVQIYCPAQKETIHWLLSDQNRIKFNPGGGVTNQAPPNILFGYQTASIADASGNFLFFSNGMKVFNRNLIPMPAFLNTDIPPGNSQLQIAPFPGQPNKYYLFYINQLVYPGPCTLKYAIIDLSLNGGLGDVISYDNLVDTLIAPVYTIVNKNGTEDFWIITHRNATDIFFSRLVTSAGIGSSPVISVAGMNAIKTEYQFLDLKPSHDGKMIAGFAYTNYSVFFAYTIHFTEVFNFNGLTGVLSNKVKSLRYPGYLFHQGQVEFSPDNRLLYQSKSTMVDGLQPCGFGSSQITQYNLCYTDSLEFSNNSVTVGNTFSFCYLVAWGGMQMGPDKKIYLPYTPSNILSRIEYPNRIGTSSTVNFSYHNLLSNSGPNLPKFYHRYIEKAVKNNIIYVQSCFPNPIQFSVSNDTIISFQWDFGDPASGISNTSTLASPQHQFSAPGIYTITVNIYGSIGQLIETLTEIIEIKNPNQRLLSPLPVDTTLCQGKNLILKANAINAFFTWQYRDTLGNLYSLGITDSVYSDVQNPGTYIVTMKQGGCNPCTQIDSITVHLLPKPYVNLGYDSDLCAGDSLQLSVYNPGASYLWSTGETTASIWVHQGDTIWSRAEFYNNGCPSLDTVVITDRPGVQFNLPSDTTLCSGQTLFLNPGIPNANYYWQDGTTANSFLISLPGDYWVRISNQFGCMHSDTIKVNYVNAQTVSLGADTSLCMGSQVTLNVNIPNATYLWNTGSTNSSITVNSTADYWVRVNNAGCTFADTVHVNFEPVPVIDLGNDTSICMLANLTLRATTPNASYLWQDGSTSDTFSVTQAGIFWVKVTRSNCSFTDSITVDFKQPPSLNLGSDTSICSGESVTLQAVNPLIQSFLWNTGSTSNSITVNTTGNYWVQVTGINQCISRDTIAITVTLPPQYSLGNDTVVCENQNLLLQVNLPAATYLWNTGVQISEINVSHPGLYWVDVSQFGCVRRDSIIIIHKPSPYVNLGQDTILCEGSTKILDAGNQSATYEWQNGSTNAQYNVTTAGIYHVHVTMNGCTSHDTVNIRYTMKPVFDLGKDAMLCQGERMVLSPGLTGVYNYLWQDGSTQSFFTVDLPGIYELTVFNDCGSFTDRIIVEKNLCRLLMPNGFTPNNDGINDLFRVKYPGLIKKFSMVVYNRWGEKIFETTNPLTGWNGKYKNVAQNSGNYVWVISYTDVDNNSATINGNVILIR